MASTAFRAVLDERQAAGCKRVEARLIEIVDVDAQAGFGQRQHQRNADMAGAADHGDVGVLDRGRRLGRRRWRGVWSWADYKMTGRGLR